MLAFIFEFGTSRKQYSKYSNRLLKGVFFGSRKGCHSQHLDAEDSEGDVDQSRLEDGLEAFQESRRTALKRKVRSIGGGYSI